MTRKFVIWGALAQASVLDSLRRKDLYVALILSIVMIGAASVVGRFGTAGLEAFLKDVALTVVTLLSFVLTVLFSARQLPEEVSRRTVYPLLARPITRFDLIFGKFLGAVALSLLSLCLFSAIAWGLMAFYRLAPGSAFGQFVALRALSLMILSALTICLSVCVTPQAAVTLSLVFALGGSALSSSTNLLAGTAGSIGRGVVAIARFVLPQLDLFDVSKKVSAGLPPLSGETVAWLAVYAAVHTALLLAAGHARFARQAL
jgi:ABC-type transport system involved in multi-copper enzyme maturation permease subunit